MIKALAIKELRESAGLVTLAALGMAWVVLSGMGRNPLQMFIEHNYTTHHLAFIGDSFYADSMSVVGLFAVLLGFKQTVWELHRNTFSFLLHRPLSRQKILAIKLTIGGLLTFGLLAVAILTYGLWANTPGNSIVPFQWSMTAESWRLAQSLVLIYLGAFLSGIRPGRWFGTRLLPLAGAILVAISTNILVFWWLRLPALGIAIAGWLVAIDSYAQTRDY